VAVPAAECGSAAKCDSALCAAVCGSAAVRHSVWQCMQQKCATVRQHGSVRCVAVRAVVCNNAIVCGSATVWQWAAVRQCAAMQQCGSAYGCAAVCDSARGSMW
jgi:hypothetical protein